MASEAPVRVAEWRITEATAPTAHLMVRHRSAALVLRPPVADRLAVEAVAAAAATVFEESAVGRIGAHLAQRS